jgi:ubiquinol-cytochrome c reductase cytochrome c1 subunit
MTVNMRPADAKSWFGVIPPDLSLTARARASGAGSGPDWIYTYLRSFYRDDTRPTGWNNLAFANVGMPHVLWQLQGSRSLETEQTKKIVDEKTGQETWRKVVTKIDTYGIQSELKNEVLPAGTHHEALHYQWRDASPAQTQYYDNQMADLVAFMTWMAEPHAKARVRLGVWVLLFLFVFTVFAWGLNRAYWKDIH